MLKIQRFLAIAICIGLLFPSLALADQANSTDNSSRREQREVCRSAAKEARTAFRTVVKANQKTFIEAMRVARTTFREAIENDVDKDTARATFKTAREAAFTARRVANLSALQARDLAKENVSTPCVKGANTEKDQKKEERRLKKELAKMKRMEKKEKAKEFKACIKAIKDTGDGSIKAAKDALKALKDSDATREEIEVAKEAVRLAKKTVRDNAKVQVQACKDAKNSETETETTTPAV